MPAPMMMVEDGGFMSRAGGECPEKCTEERTEKPPLPSSGECAILGRSEEHAVRDAEYWIRHLGLVPHPEGGCYREVYRAPLSVPDSGSESRTGRPAVTCITYLLQRGEFSAFHRLRSLELWHFLDGGAVTLHKIFPDGAHAETHLGLRADRGEHPQCAVDPGIWFAAAPEESAPYSLVGCTVVPGFDYRDFELGRREALLREFPLHRALIERFTLPRDRPSRDSAVLPTSGIADALRSSTLRPPELPPLKK